MLPSTGSFYDFECPYFNGRQCSRPYCHFRHVKKESDESSEDGNSSQSEISSFPQDGENHKLLAGLDSLLPDNSAQANAVAEAEAEARTETETEPKAQSEAVQSNSKSTSQISYAPAVPPPTYKPTPIAVLKSAHLPIPYTPLVVSRTPTAKKSKPRVEYVPHSIGGRPYFPPYSPASRVETQTTPTPSRINNTLYEIYGPDGAQFSPNDAEPSGTGYSYASVDYNPKDLDGNIANTALKKPAPTPDPSFSPPDSPPPSPPSSESPAPSPLNTDLDLSELDKLELEYESSGDGDSRPPSRLEDENCRSSPEKRKRSDSTSGGSSKKLKSSHSEKQKNGHAESEKKSSSRSEVKKSSSSKNSKSSSSSSSHRRSSSSSDKKDKHKDKHSEKDRNRHKKDESKEKSSRHKDKSRSSHSSSSKDKNKSRSKESEKERDRHKSKESNDKHSRRSSSSNNSSSKKPESKSKTILPEEDEDLLRKVEADLDADLEDADFIEQQCLELFSEYHESTKISETAEKEDPRVSIENSETPVATISTKKRIAHSNSSNVQVPSVKPPPTPKINPHSIMRERFDKVAQSRPTVLVPKPYSATNPLPLTATVAPAAKKRIHSVPNVAMLLKPPCLPTSASSGASASRSLNNDQQRVDEFGRLVKVRVAHAPSPAAQATRKPMVDPSDCRKFKASTRQAYVTKLYEAYTNAGFGEASHDMALDTERSCAQGTESIGVYSHRIIQILKDLRACAESSRKDIKMDGLTGLANRVCSHSAMLDGKKGANVSWSIEKVKKPADVTDNPLSLYDTLLLYVLSEKQLEENGFPIASEEKGVALLKKRSFRAIDQPTAENERICVRCLKHYIVNKHGEQVKEEECLYHWGRRITVRRFREAETKYTCCDTSDQGCCVGSCHVFEASEDRRAGFMSTLSKSEEDPGVYALDCEMCYTTGGLELTRVTVVKSDLSVAYEALVKPKNRILDYNTRYSGLTEEDMKNAKTTLLQVQAALLGMFSNRTILIGHSLESDMKALKLVHPTIVDTSVVFPHKMGLPYKKALRTLAAEHLKKIIQNDVGGHDSKEDAVTAMELMIWKVKEDAKTR